MQRNRLKISKKITPRLGGGIALIINNLHKTNKILSTKIQHFRAAMHNFTQKCRFLYNLSIIFVGKSEFRAGISNGVPQIRIRERLVSVIKKKKNVLKC